MLGLSGDWGRKAAILYRPPAEATDDGLSENAGDGALMLRLMVNLPSAKEEDLRLRLKLLSEASESLSEEKPRSNFGLTGRKEDSEKLGLDGRPDTRAPFSCRLFVAIPDVSA